MITIEYNGVLIEIPNVMWGAFEDEQDTALEFLGADDSPDIVLDDDQYQKMVELAKTSKIASYIISELSQTGEQYENAPMRKWETGVKGAAEFDESEHPRAEDGEFTFKGEGVNPGARGETKNQSQSPVNKVRFIADTHEAKIKEIKQKVAEILPTIDPIYDEYGDILHEQFKAKQAYVKGLEKSPDKLNELNTKIEKFEKERLEPRWAEYNKLNEQAKALNNNLKTEVHETLYLRPESELNTDVHTNIVMSDKNRAEMETKLAEANDFIGRITHEEYITYVDTVGIRIDNSIARAYANNREIYIASDDSRATIIHEIGHTIENSNPEVLRQAKEFYEWRTQGQSLEKLNVLTGDKNYRDDEVTKKDEFKNPYCGKLYKSGGHTELVSMGAELLYTDPVGFARTDPEYFTWIVDVLRKKK